MSSKEDTLNPQKSSPRKENSSNKTKDMYKAHEAEKNKVISQKEGQTKWLAGSIFLSFLIILTLQVFSFNYINKKIDRVSEKNKENIELLLNTEIDDEKINEKLRTNTLESEKKLFNVLNQQQTIIKINQDNLNKMQQQLVLTQSKIEKNKGALEKDLLISEVDFLIRSASFRLALTGDQETTRQLLNAADNRLKMISDVKIIPIRKAIANDIAQINLKGKEDVVGMYLKLESLSRFINNWPLKKLTFNDSSEVDKNKKTNEEVTGNWQHFKKTSTRVLKKWFQVSHSSKKINPLFNQEEEHLIRKNIELLIQQTQWGLIQRNSDIYGKSLEKLSAYINQYFDSNDEKIKYLNQEISLLLNYKIAEHIAIQLESEEKIKKFTINYFNADGVSK